MTNKDDDDEELKDLALAMASLNPEQKSRAEEFGRLCCEGSKGEIIELDLGKKTFRLNWFVKPSSHELVMNLLAAFLQGNVKQTGEILNLEIVNALHAKLNPTEFLECTQEEVLLLLMLLYNLHTGKFENLTRLYDPKEFEADVIKGFFGRLSG